MVDVGIVQRKTGKILFCLHRLEKFKDCAETDFLCDQDAIDIVTHNLFVALQQVIDLGTHVIADDRLGEMGYMSDIPGILVREGIITPESGNRLIHMIGFRNILAHEYGDLDLHIVHHILQQNLEDFHQFLDAIMLYAKM